MATLLLFPTEPEAAAAEALISADMGYPIIGKNAATGIEDASAQVTMSWAVPSRHKDGSWSIPKPDDEYMPDVVGYAEAEALPASDDQHLPDDITL